MKKHCLITTMLVFVLMGVFNSSLAQTANQREEFIKRAAKEAKIVHDRFGVPISICIAQGIYESRYGTSELAVKYNNYHGLKAYHWNGAKATVRVTEEGRKIKATFRAFDNMEQAFLNYGEFLSKQRYKPAFKYKNNSMKFLEEILDRGFCPSDEYLTDIKRIMKRHNLAQYDKS